MPVDAGNHRLGVWRGPPLLRSAAFSGASTNRGPQNRGSALLAPSFTRWLAWAAVGRPFGASGLDAARRGKANRDFLPSLDTLGRAGLQPRRNRGSPGLSAPCRAQLAAASCARHGTHE